MRFIKNSILMLACLSICVACKGSWWGKDKSLNLKGERIRITTTKNDLKINDQLKLAQVYIPQPKINDGWFKSSGITSAQIDNLYLDAPIEKKVSFKVTSSSDFTLGSTPIIANEKIFVSSAAGTVEAFDAISGNSLWTNDYFYKLHGASKFNFFSGTYVNGGLSYNNNILYATGGLAEIVALNPETGELIWHTKLGSPTRSTPISAHNLIIVQSVDNKAFALDSATGKIMWTHHGIAEDLSILATYAPAVSGRNVIIQYSSGEIFALKIDSGDEVWASNISSQANKVNTEKHLNSVITSPTVDSGMILAFGNDGTIAAIKETSGEIAWKKDIGINKQFWVSGNSIFALTNENKLVCLDKNSGNVRWISELELSKANNDADKDIFYGTPIVANSKVMLVTSDGKLLSFNATTGTLEDEQVVSEDVYLMPVVVQGSLFLLDNSGSITRYSKNNV